MNEKALIEITVSPRSSKSKITIDNENNIKIYLNSPPADGKANAECISLLSKKIKVAKSKISIRRGLKSRKKEIIIEGLRSEELFNILRGKNNK